MHAKCYKKLAVFWRCFDDPACMENATNSQRGFGGILVVLHALETQKIRDGHSRPPRTRSIACFAYQFMLANINWLNINVNKSPEGTEFPVSYFLCFQFCPLNIKTIISILCGIRILGGKLWKINKRPGWTFLFKQHIAYRTRAIVSTCLQSFF